jgi:hypothetical protein
MTPTDENLTEKKSIAKYGSFPLANTILTTLGVINKGEEL